MTNRKTEANRRNSLSSCGPRSAAGKKIASRNALRHGLAALTHRQSAPADEIAQFARAICGNDDDPAIFAQAVVIAENEFTLRAIRAQQVVAVERLRESDAVPYARKNNILKLAKVRCKEADLAEKEIQATLPGVLEKYKDQIPPSLPDDGAIVPHRLKALLQYPATAEEEREALDLAKEQVKERDEYEALEAAIRDLLRLDRYERRAWSRQKRAINQFTNLKTMRALRLT
jgi:hypothetical protein